MSNGVLLFANNNEQVDYVKQAVWSSHRIKKHLGCEVAIATDSPDYLEKFYSKHLDVIDHIIPVDYHSTQTKQHKRYRDGTMSEKSLTWKNTNRVTAYDITPFQQTIVIDTDVIINNDLYNNCWHQPEDVLIDRHPIDLHLQRQDTTLDRISDKSIDFFWATAFFFRKSSMAKMLFDTINHVIDNYDFYRMMYQIIPQKLRNDFVFSIAIHILNGFQSSDHWPRSMPGRMFMMTDCDILHSMEDQTYTMLLDKITHPGQYFVNTVSGVNMHVMNKFSLGRIIDKEFADE